MADKLRAGRAAVGRARREIVELLKSAGWWRDELALQAEMAAADLVLLRRLRDEVLGLESAVITEVTDHGAKRRKPDPLLAAYQAQANQVRQDFKALSMNYDSRVAKPRGGEDADDPLARLMGFGAEEGAGDE